MANKSTAEPGIKVIATNRKARYEYEVLETYEAGIVLVGTEVKSLRNGRCNLTGGHASIESGEAFLRGVEIEEYSFGNRQNHEPQRRRKLLLRKIELRKLQVRTRERGFTLVPLRLYFKEGRAKAEIALVKGRKVHDRRQAKAKQEASREMARAIGRRRKER